MDYSIILINLIVRLLMQSKSLFYFIHDCIHILYYSTIISSSWKHEISVSTNSSTFYPTVPIDRKKDSRFIIQLPRYNFVRVQRVTKISPISK